LHGVTPFVRLPVMGKGGRLPEADVISVGGTCERCERHERRVYSMADNGRLEVSEVGGVTVIRFVDRKILDEANIQELGKELFALVEEDNRKSLLLNFSNVEFLSSAALGKLITLDKKVKAHGGKLKLCNIRPEIYEVFAITKLNKLFDIREDEAAGLDSF
jgi:anti-sigma B factor antagonist